MSARAEWQLEARLEPSAPKDPALDYCLWPYARPVESAPGSMRSSVLLFHSLWLFGASGHMLAAVDAIRDAAGDFGTVFGVKIADGRVSWEFYFYDYNRWERRFGIGHIANALADKLDWTAPTDDTKPYFMFSIEFDDRHAKGLLPLDRVDVYVGTPDTGTSAGICFGLDDTGYELRNLYYFYNARTQFDAACAKAFATVRFDGRHTDQGTLFWPEMQGVETLVVANKRRSDGVYFSRIRLAQLVLFLERAGFPREIADFIDQNYAELDHHLFDVGYDYEMRPGGRLQITKGSFYGLL